MIKIFNSSLIYKGYLDKFESFQCKQLYCGTGSFLITTIYTVDTVELLSIGDFVVYNNFAGMIDSVNYTRENNKTILKASGNDLTGLLDTRIIWNNFNFAGKSEDFLRRIVNENAITAEASRIIPFLALGSISGLPQLTERQTENESLLDECVNVCNVADYGVSLDLSIDEKKIYFKVYEGKDKTKEVVICEDFDNVATQDYIKSCKPEITTCLVKSESQSVSVGAAAAGFNRKETVVKSSKTQDSLTLDAFQKILSAEGKEKLVLPTENIDADLVNVDLSVGDKVTIKSFGVQFTTRVTEKITSIQNGIITNSYVVGTDIIGD